LIGWGGEKLQKKKFYAILGISVIVLSSFALVYAAAWTPDDMAAYMQNIGRHKIYQTNWILYNQIDPKIDTILDHSEQDLDYETLEIEIQPLLYTTNVDYSPSVSTLYNTQIGGGDTKSDVYAYVTWRGEKVDATVTATVKDGGQYFWSVTIFPLETGLKDVYVTASTGVLQGSYLVEVSATLNVLGTDYYGKSTYTIDCTSTTT
jgi:hypothetical protein